MKLLIGGDFFVSDEYRGERIFDVSILDLFRSADYRIVNLEAPITNVDNSKKIIKTGPHLRMSSDTIIPLLKELKINAVTMANNHIMDYGKEGLLDTLKVLDFQNIKHLGAGENLNAASNILTLFKNNKKIAVLNFCESEWSIAKVDFPGANPLDIIDNSKKIIEAKKTHDLVIVIIHGGHEYYHLPSPRMKNQYRFYAEQGADIVVGHHTHCIGGYENHQGIPIVYSLGNLLFTKNNTNEQWYKGLVLEVDLASDKINPVFHPVKQDKNSFKLSLLKNQEGDDINKHFESINLIIKNDEKLNLLWEDYCERQRVKYLNFWSPSSYVSNRYLRFLIKKIFGPLISHRMLIYYLNLIRCEAHKDLSVKFFEKTLR